MHARAGRSTLSRVQNTSREHIPDARVQHLRKPLRNVGASRAHRESLPPPRAVVNGK